MVSQICPIIGEQIVIIFMTLCFTVATVWPVTNPLILGFSQLYLKNDTSKPFSNQDKMQLLTKFLKNLYKGSETRTSSKNI